MIIGQKQLLQNDSVTVNAHTVSDDRSEEMTEILPVIVAVRADILCDPVDMPGNQVNIILQNGLFYGIDLRLIHLCKFVIFFYFVIKDQNQGKTASLVLKIICFCCKRSVTKLCGKICQSMMEKTGSCPGHDLGYILKLSIQQPELMHVDLIRLPGSGKQKAEKLPVLSQEKTLKGRKKA